MTDVTSTPVKASDENIRLRGNNAGLVILQSYFRPLFSRLGLTQNDQFISAEAQRRAVHYLQFLATGRTDTAEQYLVLNKVLCGLAVDAPIEPSIEMTEAEQALSTDLLKAVIRYWPALGHSSPEGLRGNFLVRDGLLRNDSQRWELIVERKPYDVLLARSPLSYSVIKFPWMEKALYVTWPT